MDQFYRIPLTTLLKNFYDNNIKYIFPEFEKMKIEYWRELWGCVIIFNMQGKFLGAICIQDIRLVTNDQ